MALKGNTYKRERETEKKGGGETNWCYPPPTVRRCAVQKTVASVGNTEKAVCVRVCARAHSFH